MARLVGAAPLRLLAFPWMAVSDYAPGVLTPAPVEDDFVIRGLCYHPVPLRTPAGFAELSQDDWMSERSKPLWGPRYRGDLRVVRSLGANMVRLFLMNPDNSHMNFLDEAFSVGLYVAVGLDSKHPEGSDCQQSGFNCYEQFKSTYSRALRSGLLMADKTYHPALMYVTIHDFSKHRGVDASDADIARAIVSAFDGILDAEREEGMTGRAINFTVTFSNFTLSNTAMQDMHTAMQHPDAFDGYQPNNDVALAYEHRWTHSFIAEGNAQAVQSDLIDKYQLKFPSTPMFIAEYRKPANAGFDQVGEVLSLAGNSSLFLGLFYFQYQVSNWDAGSKGQSGLFGLGEHIITTMDYFGKEYNVWCLKPLPARDPDDLAEPSRAEWLSKIYGGSYVDPAEEDVCDHSAAAVSLNQNGYETIAKQNNTHRMAEFLSRMVRHLGAVIVDEAQLTRFAEVHMDTDVSSFEVIHSTLQSRRPSWASFDESGARCVADRSADAFDVAAAMQHACEAGDNATKRRCKDVPRSCQSDTFAVADYVFSSFFAEAKKEATSEGAGDPLGPSCYRDGLGIYASSAVWWNLYPECVVDAGGFLRGHRQPPGLPDGYTGLTLLGLPLVHPRTGSDKQPWSIVNASTVSTTSAAGTGSPSSDASQAPEPNGTAGHAGLGAAAGGAAGGGLAEVLRLGAVGHGWAGMLAFAAVALGVAVVWLRSSPRCGAGAGGKAGRRGRRPPPSTTSSEEDVDDSASASESECERAPESAPLSPWQHAAAPRAPMLPIDRRLRRPTVYRQHSVAQGAARVDAVAMPTVVRTQTQMSR